jgi:4a-hydroxytetrahydrobiopterin dehydratase
VIHIKKLTEEQVHEHLSRLTGWKLTDEKWIEKKYRFSEFLNGIQFVQKIAERSDAVNHHPFISINYKLVTLRISSWQARGLTELDFDLARQFDAIFMRVKK